jgi:phage N-6-adenine-methyltransferase
VSLVGYKVKNHPQQVGKRGARPEIDDRATTPEVFDPLNERFAFTIDVAASIHNTKCPRYYTAERDGLAQSWAGQRVWCNPPHSNLEAWVQKAWHEWTEDDAPELIVMLVPANRTEQRWWQQYVEPAHRERHPSFRVEFLAGRLRFLAPGATEIKPNERPPYGCCLLIWQSSEHFTSIIGRDG